MSATITYLCWMAFLGLLAKCAMKRGPDPSPVAHPAGEPLVFFDWAELDEIHELEELLALPLYQGASD